MLRIVLFFLREKMHVPIQLVSSIMCFPDIPFLMTDTKIKEQVLSLEKK